MHMYACGWIMRRQKTEDVAYVVVGRIHDKGRKERDQGNERVSKYCVREDVRTKRTRQRQACGQTTHVKLGVRLEAF